MSASTDETRSEEFGLELAEIAAETRAGADPAPRLLQLLTTLGEAPAGIITRWDRQAGRHRVAAVRGYSPQIVDHVVSNAFHSDPAYRAIAADRARPLRSWQDLEFDYATTRTAREFLLPEGYRGGVSLRLVTRRGRYVGDLHMSTEARCLPSAAAMRLLHRCHTLLAACQEMPPFPGSPAALLPDAENVTLIRRDGSAQPVDGRAPEEGTALLEALRAVVAADGTHAPDRSYHWLDRTGAWHHVRVRQVRAGVTVSTNRVAAPHGLSHRQLEILDKICDGHSNLAIARRFHLSERTVAHHVERILGKLHVGSRAAAAALAEQEGLRLLGPPHSPSTTAGG
ncbi:hypothetical protein DI005_09270 [Prauserella sp. PE36]|uniref:helix-turn-helix transcriptional regulator n=1 Tax=Prauserella sp. PE36 TaxID=1504709 RepID=UPI000DE4E721|nr:helix-turn-helix transcriptional regulator [Prauserella sp. PE36]RBM21704.1 hypothetical protein DI005_09270 [Prauserella sp. PE36]